MASAKRLPLPIRRLLAARLRAWRVVGVTIWPAPRTRSAAKCPQDGQFVSALVRAQREGNQRADPDHGKGRLQTTPVCRPVRKKRPQRPRKPATACTQQHAVPPEAKPLARRGSP